MKQIKEIYFNLQKSIKQEERMKRAIFFASIICVVVATSALGAIPKQINYQGILSGSTGSPLADSTVDVEFNIYTTALAGNSVWAETLSVTTGDQGQFSVNLGLVHPIEDSVFRQTERYLSINVESNGEIDPRTKLTSVGYANRVSTIGGSKGGSVSGETVVVGSGPNDVLVLGVSDPNVALELRSGTFGGNPYIDFANDAAEDYDARIQLDGENGLLLSVDELVAIPQGDLGIGTIAPGTTPGLESMRLEIADANGLNSDIGIRVQGGGATGSGAMTFAKSRGNLATPTIVQSGDMLGNVVFQGYDGTDFASVAAWIRAAVDGSPGADDLPGRLEFMTTADGSALPSVRMTVNSAGNVGIGATPAYKLEVSGAVMMEDAAAPTASAGHSGVYSSGGELFALDAAGNSTQLSPHDTKTGDWIFYSKNVKTGRVVQVNMEKLVRKIEELTGEQFLIESWQK